MPPVKGSVVAVGIQLFAYPTQGVANPAAQLTKLFMQKDFPAVGITVRRHKQFINHNILSQGFGSRSILPPSHELMERQVTEI